MDPAWISVIVGVCSFILTAVGGIIAVTVSIKKAESSAIKANDTLEKTLTKLLNQETRYLSDKMSELREKFSNELAIIKNDMEHGEARFIDQGRELNQLKETLHKMELELERYKRTTTQVKPS